MWKNIVSCKKMKDLVIIPLQTFFCKPFFLKTMSYNLWNHAIFLFWRKHNICTTQFGPNSKGNFFSEQNFVKQHHLQKKNLWRGQWTCRNILDSIPRVSWDLPLSNFHNVFCCKGYIVSPCLKRGLAFF